MLGLVATNQYKASFGVYRGHLDDSQTSSTAPRLYPTGKWDESKTFAQKCQQSDQPKDKDQGEEKLQVAADIHCRHVAIGSRPAGLAVGTLACFERRQASGQIALLRRDILGQRIQILYQI